MTSARTCARVSVVQSSSDQIAVPGGEAPIDVTVHLSRRSGPVSGTVSPLGGEPAAFHGWLELMDALERIRGPLEVERPA